MRILVFVVGASSLGAEIAAARLLAPSFGASTIIWANTIGVILVALSAGYWLGGRLADRAPSRRRLSQLVLGAAGLLALVPFAGRPFLGAIDAGEFLGSLAGLVVLLAVPVLLLGCVAPYAVRLCVGSVQETGRVAGRLYAISTAGSLAGTWLSALVLLPLIGTRLTFAAFAAALALAALPGLRRPPGMAPARA